ncbi:cupin domain-containing protein [Rhizobium sp. CG5]|uniref:cupin domain-containing protein n=1 Tax=Rhizobium sp. CG5 TaxID=2726076 RepID=UPI002033F3C2|nr:cupin domain-containing protein [Rhizobium sp. CG5]MCM2472081.1 cupin domain-containing protein [Rhizobium sp. CG5]
MKSSLTQNAAPAINSTLHFLGNLVTFRACSADTEGSFSLIETLTAPGAGAPPHIQQDEEAFLVLEGQYAFMLEDNTLHCGPGEFVYVKPGTRHAFHNPTDKPSRMLIVNLPGGPHESFFQAVGEPVEAGTQTFPPVSAPNFPAIAATAARFGIEILPPKAQ